MRFSEGQLATELSSLNGWAPEGQAIRKSFEFKDFTSAIRFANEVAELAERLKHHPDIMIHYNKVILSLSSHDSGGVTSRDIKLATQIDSIRQERAA